MKKPLVSIVLPVYNGELYVGDAIESLIAQTYSYFELIIINDGSSDQSAEVIDSFRDSRIRVFHQTNQGLSAALNRGISLAKGKYIARQDADDLSNCNRLALQVEYMEKHEDCVLLGTWAQIMEGNRLVNRYHRHPVDELTLRYQLFFNNPFVHSSVLLRRSGVLEVGGYTNDSERQPPEDYELWTRLSRIGSVANLGEILQIYRETPGSISRVGPSPFRDRLVMFCMENLAAATGLSKDDPSIRAIAIMTHAKAIGIQEKPDFARMKLILFNAINSLGTGDALLPLRRDAIWRIQRMKVAWMLRKLLNTASSKWLCEGQPLKFLTKRLRKLVKLLNLQ